MKTLEEIKELSKNHYNSMNGLQSIRAKIKAEMELIEEKYEEEFNEAVDKAAETELKLYEAIKESPALFVKPRTVKNHGIKAGYNMTQDKYEIADVDKTVALIKEKRAGEVKTLIQVKETVIVEPLKNLKTEELKELGITLVKGVDEVTIKVADKGISKVMSDVLKESSLKDAA